MNDIPRSIFRREAVQRYMERHEQTILPKFVSPHIFYYLWTLLGLLLIGGVLAWATPIPIYASGFGIVVTQTDNTQAGDEIVLAVFLPPESLPRLHAGQAVFLQGNTTTDRPIYPIIAVEPQVISPADARKRFALDTSIALGITQPAALAIAQLPSFPDGRPASAYLGSMYRVEVEVGSRQLISLWGE